MLNLSPSKSRRLPPRFVPQLHMGLLRAYKFRIPSVVLCATKLWAGRAWRKPGGLRFVIIAYGSRVGCGVANSARGPLVMLQAMKEEPPLNAKCKDKFLIQSTTITPDKEAMSLAEIVGRHPAQLCGVSCANLGLSVGKYRRERRWESPPAETSCNISPSRGADFGRGR